MSYRFRRDRSLFWTVVVIAVILGGVTWLGYYWSNALNQ